MPALSWTDFAGLPGGAEANFELLCRGIVRRTFGKFGSFRALANQPGVEFHLLLEQESPQLGSAGRWWGWQCKWYDLPRGRAIGTTRKAKIEDGIKKTEEHLPGVTDWVLWTRHPLTKGDQEWFYAISTKMKLHLWTGDEVDDLLVGDAAVLRSTYFGELVLRPEDLSRLHRQAVAPIKKRWLHAVHEVVDAEVVVRQMLGHTERWGVLQDHAALLRRDANELASASEIPGELGECISQTKDSCLSAADGVTLLFSSIQAGDIDGIHLELDRHADSVTKAQHACLRKLRNGRHPASLGMTNALVSLRDTAHLREQVAGAYGQSFVGVVGGAGCGKTQLAAELTAEAEDRPAGILLHGRDLFAGSTLDDLARGVRVAASPIPSMEALFAALDAAGQRACRRLPIVIDALNEAEDPRMWRPLLQAAIETLGDYPHVLLICTTRPDFVEEALPEGALTLDLPGFEGHEASVMRSYFNHFLIDPADVALPWELLQHPLTLRLFCEVTNPDRRKLVGVEAMPGSLTTLFERFLDQCAKRIAELSPRHHRFFPQEVRKILERVGELLWEAGTRGLPMDELRAELGDDGRPWDASIVRALEQEGVLIKVSVPMEGNLLAPVYDALAGHLIADALVRRHTEASLAAWFAEPVVSASFGSDYDHRHPFATDVFASMAGMVSQRFRGKQLWMLVPQALHAEALRLSAQGEGTHLDKQAVDALRPLVITRGDSRRDILHRLRQTRSAQAHPLNATFLDACLRPLTVADRDLRWSEWLRRNHEHVVADSQRLERRWGRKVGSPDHLRARWVMWTLTSTVGLIRDHATRALYTFGRSDPQALFDLTLDSLDINDLYVPERMLAASYGVAMAHQVPDAAFAEALEPFLLGLTEAFLGEDAQRPTSHWLMRFYVRQLLAFGHRFYKESLPVEFGAGSWPPFAPSPTVDSIAKTDERHDEARGPLHSDFANYTVGRLFDDRANYQNNHSGHQEALAHIRGVIWASGWRRDRFQQVDRQIQEQQYRRWDRSPATDRYGKKYSWMGYYTYAGVLADNGSLDAAERLSDIGIDPSFPRNPPPDPDSWVGEDWLAPETEDPEAWACGGPNGVPSAFINRSSIAGKLGPWIAVYAHLDREDRILGRRAQVQFTAMALSEGDLPLLTAAIAAGRARISHAADLPSDYYIFAGEIPWNGDFSGNNEGCYVDRIWDKHESIDVEVLAHRYSFEGYHSELNEAGGSVTPSAAFSNAQGLSSVAGSFAQQHPDGTWASITLAAPDGFAGQVLYVKASLLKAYLGGRTILWTGWGQRFPTLVAHDVPDWWRSLPRDQTEERWLLTAERLGLDW